MPVFRQARPDGWVRVVSSPLLHTGPRESDVWQPDENFCVFFNVPVVRVGHDAYAPPWVVRLGELFNDNRNAFVKDGVWTYACLCLRNLIARAVANMLTPEQIVALLDEAEAVVSVSASAFAEEFCIHATWGARR